MPQVSYNVKLKFANQEDSALLVRALEAQRLAYNECSKLFFGLEKKDRNVKGIHGGFYTGFRKSHPEIPSQIVIRAEQEVLSAYRSIKSNKHKIDAPAAKKKLSMRLDKRLYSFKINSATGKYLFSLPTLDGRIKCELETYDRVNELLAQYPFCDPLIFQRNDTLFISLTFKIEDKVPSNQQAIGVDLGIRAFAATSEGNLYVDKPFNERRRRLRWNKRKLMSRGNKSAKRHLKKLRRKESNATRNFVHHLANRIIKDTKAGYIVLEDLSGIKKKKNKWQNKNRISQIPFFILKTILTYKALLHGKQVTTVSPAFTSQIDSRTGKKEGERKGRRFKGSDGVTLDADINAAINIAHRSKHPVSIGNYLDGQAVVNRPIVGCLRTYKPFCWGN